MTSNSNDAVAARAREATENTVEVFKNSVTTFTDQLAQFQLPTVDLTEPVARYFQYVQQAVDLNRDLVTKWAELVTTMSGSLREQAQQVTGMVKDQTNTVAELATRQVAEAEHVVKELADKAEQVAKELAEEAEEAEKAQAREAKRIEREEAKKAEHRAEEAEEAEKAQAREAKRIERAEAKEAHDKTHEVYEGQTKAELSDQLEARGLPKTGNLEDLIERLVSADTE